MAETLATILASITTFLTSLVTWFGTIAEQITSNPLLFIFLVAMPVVGFVISVVLWLVRSRGSRGRG